MSEPIAREALTAPSARQVALVSLIGTTIEWYDFQIYGLAASLVFSRLFFPDFDPVVGTLLSFATFGVGFLARPLGSVVFGHLGDRVGRRRVLMISLMLMGSATVLIGLLPSYATVGVAAPILLVLLRMVQGFGLGGEWGGAAVYAVESAPEGRRGRYGGWPQMGSPLGLIVATVVFSGIGLLGDEALLTWGWRVPFLISAILVLVGLYMRRNLADTPAFSRARERNTIARYPVAQVIRRHPRELLLTFGLFSATSGSFYIFATFIPAYGTTTLGLAPPILTGGLLVFAVVELFAVMFATISTDRFGRRPLFIGCAALTAVVAYPMFLLVDTRSALAIVAVMVVGGASVGIMYGIPGAMGPEQFPAEVRYSGAGLAYQISAAVVGGLTPVLTTALAAAAGGTWPVAVILALMAVTGLIAAVLCRETAGSGLRESEMDSSVARAPRIHGPAPTD